MPLRQRKKIQKLLREERIDARKRQGMVPSSPGALPMSPGAIAAPTLAQGCDILW